MKKRMESFWLVLCMLIAVFGSTAFTVSAAGKTALNQTAVTLNVGEKYRLWLENIPKNGTVTWSSASKSKATVSKKGVVTAKKQGKATIRAKLTYQSGGKRRTKNFSCKVTIRKAMNLGRSLVVYFSVPEISSGSNTTVDAVSSASIVVSGRRNLGNIQYAASVIQKNTNAESFRIQPRQAYPTNHSALVSLASEEQEQNARPKIRNTLKNLSSYDTIFIGYPIWWSDMPQILYTFFDTYDFSGKTIVPFTVHGGSGLSGTVSRIQKLEPNANVYTKALSISRENVQNSESRIVTWLNGLK